MTRDVYDGTVIFPSEMSASGLRRKGREVCNKVADVEDPFILSQLYWLFDSNLIALQLLQPRIPKSDWAGGTAIMVPSDFCKDYARPVLFQPTQDLQKGNANNRTLPEFGI
jgi:hypothetical protein